MQVYVKETLHVLDYQDNIVGTIFNSDDHRSPGYAFNISITEANTGYSDLKFEMPNIIINDKGDKIKNPLQALLTPLVKLRYHREVYYTGEQPITVREPQGYGDQVEYIDKTYSNVYPDNVIEDYIMDYIVQPVDTKRDVLKTTSTFTAMDYPRFNLSKKRVGLTIAQETLTKNEWSLYENKPIDEPGMIKYIQWNEDLNTTIHNPNVPLVWDPENAHEYPLNKTDITRLMAATAEWPYGLLATSFYWPIVSTARFEGIMYKKNGFLVLQIYDFYNLSTEGIDPEHYIGRYSWEWTQIYEVDSYLCPNNALNYLNHILEGTNWTVAMKEVDGQMVPDVDIIQTTIPNPRGSTTSSETVDLTSNVNISNGNCYNAITATCQALQLYPVFDCVNRTVALHEFAGKNYGLVYALGKNVKDDTTKADGEKVITKLYCAGGKDYSGDADIHIGPAERSYLKTLNGFYRSINDAPTQNVEGYWAIVDNSIPAANFNYTTYELQENDGEAELVPVTITVHDDRVKNYWNAGANRQVYFLNSNNQWVLGTKLPSGLWQGNAAGQTVIIDPITGTSGEWSPNDDMYINSRSPYGTNYILNLRWAYQNNWITKEQILELYQYEKQINDLNIGFMDKYTEDYSNTRKLYNDAVNNYDVAQDGYQSSLYAMENKYYNVIGEYSEGIVYCFHKAPKGTYVKNGKNYIKLFHCYDCDYTRAVNNNKLIDPTGATPDSSCPTLSSTCPSCGSEDIQTDEIYIPIYNDYKDKDNRNWDEYESLYPYGDGDTKGGYQYNPHLKGYYQRLVSTLDRSNKEWTIDDYESRVSMIKGMPLENSTVTMEDGYTYKLDGVYVRSSSGQIEVWNNTIIKYIQSYGDMLTYLRVVNKMLERIKKLEEMWDQWKALVDGLHAMIQEKFGDYLIEGNYTNKEQPYINLLFQEGLEASDKYSVPEITYNLNVVDSSGLVEYREPTVTKYRCAECDYISYTPITVCPRCENELIVTENDVYNDLVRLLHSVGQIVPKAGDYVTVYDEPMGMYGVPALITQITRYPDNPINNRIELNTSYTDDEELVGNIITATNTVLNNADIYARTAVLKSDGTIDANSIRESLDNSNANITIVGTNGNVLLDGSGLRASDPTDPHRAMKYAGNGIFNTTNLDNIEGDPVIWEKMISPSGINATYLNSGSIDTNKLTITSGLAGKVILDQYGLSVKKNTNKTNHIEPFSYTEAKNNANYAANWGTNNNLASFIGVDTENNPLIYTKGMLVAEEGSNIANWITSNQGFYHLSTGSDNRSYKDLWLSPSGLNRSNYNHRSGNTDVVAKLGGTTDSIFSFYANDTFGVTPDGDLYSTSGQIGGFNITTSKLYSTNANSHITGMASSSYAGDPAFYAGGGDPWSTSGWANSTPFYVTNEGFLKATNANITGTITTDNLTATGGSISNLTANNITATNLTMSSGSITLGSKFKVTSDGTLTCSSANVSGTITSSSISSSSINCSNKFKVSSAGYVSATSGNIGGWELASDGFSNDNSSIKTNGTFAFYCQIEPGSECIFNNGFRLHTSDQQRLYTPKGITIGAGVSSAPTTESGQLYLTGAKTGDGSSRSTSGVQIYAASGASIRLNAEKNVWIRSGGSIGLEGEGNGIFIGDGTMGNAASTIKVGSTSTSLYLKGQAYMAPSSRKMKENIVPLSDEETNELYNVIKNTTFYSYNYKEKYGYGKTEHRGFLIDDLEDTIVDKYLHFIQDEKDKDIKTFNPTEIGRMNLILINKLQKKIEKLEQEIIQIKKEKTN